MREFWGSVPFLGVFLVAVFAIHAVWQMQISLTETDKVRFEQCIAADKQWVQGSCVK
jgi:hypothetical protein